MRKFVADICKLISVLACVAFAINGLMYLAVNFHTLSPVVSTEVIECKVQGQILPDDLWVATGSERNGRREYRNLRDSSEPIDIWFWPSGQPNSVHIHVDPKYREATKPGAIVTLERSVRKNGNVVFTFVPQALSKEGEQ